MRGAPDDPQPNGDYQGIIPADAGSTQRTLAAESRLWDHPRGCGEHDQPHGSGPIY